MFLQILVPIFVIGVFFAGFSYIVYELFFNKKPNELTNVEKRYVDPALYTAKTDVEAAEDYIKVGAEKIRTKV